jgi:hypothetical protein
VQMPDGWMRLVTKANREGFKDIECLEALQFLREMATLLEIISKKDPQEEPVGLLLKKFKEWN